MKNGHVLPKAAAVAARTIGLALLISGLTLILIACGGRDSAFTSEYQLLRQNQAGPQLFSSLLLLDQKYPGHLALKVDLGAALLAAGDLEKAVIYLKSGEALTGRSKDSRLKALLFRNLAELCFRSGRFPDAIDYAGKALALDENDQRDAIFTRGKAFAKTGKKKEALEDLSRGWVGLRESMRQEDFRVYWALLIDAGRYPEALEALGEYQYRYLYETGIGLTESLLYEKTGKIDESVLSAFKELEYQRSGGGADTTLLTGSLGKLRLKLEDGKWNPGRRGISLADALLLYARGQWGEAVRELEKPGLLPALPFGRYLLLSSSLEAAHPKAQDFEEYRSLEPYHKSLAAYYYHLWRGMRNGAGAYSTAVARPILEKCILLSPRTPIALESRKELGRLLGLSPADGAKLLLGAELDAVGSRIAAGEDTRLLDPVIELLSTPDNEYQLSAMLLLKKLAVMKHTREYFTDRSRSSSGKLKERLAFILSE